MNVDAYTDFVRQSPQGMIYHYPWWLDAVAPGQYEIITVTKGNEIRAAWPIVWQGKPRRSAIVMPILTQKLGVLLPPMEGRYVERLSKSNRLVEQLIEQLPSNILFNQHFHENFTNWLPFYWHGFRQTTRYTYLIGDLSDPEVVWSEMRDKTRNTIRKAEKQGIHVRKTDDVEHFYTINTKTFTRQDRDNPYGLEVVLRIDEACRNNAGRKILVAEGPDGRPHAAVYVVFDDRCAIVLMSGADAQLRESGAGALLHWEIIKFASSVAKQLDFEGSMIQGIERFYRGLGGRQTPYFRIWGSKQQNNLTKAGGFLHRARRKLARIIAPHE